MNVKFYFLSFIFFANLSVHSQWIDQFNMTDMGLILSMDFGDSLHGSGAGWILLNGLAYGRATYTTDGGLSWSFASLPDSVRTLNQVHFINNSVVYGIGAYRPGGSVVSDHPGKRNNTLNKFSSQICDKYNSGSYGILSAGDTSHGSFFISTDAGQSWALHGTMPDTTWITDGFTFPTPSTGYAIGISAVTSQNLNKYWILKTTDSGSTWKSLANPVGSNYEFYDIFFLNPNTGFIAAKYLNGPNWWQGGVMRTTDGGTGWTMIPIDSLESVYSVCFVNSLTGFIGGYTVTPTSFVYKSTDAGFTWVDCGLSISSHRIDKISFFTGSGTGIFLSNSVDQNTQCVWATNNYGVTWHDTCFFNPQAIPQALYLGSTTNMFFGMGDWYTDIWIYHTTDGGLPIGIKPISQNIPDKFALYQNNPNPFNPTTTIKFAIPNPSEGGAVIVTLKIYDVLGREVASLIPPLWGGEEGLHPGTHEVEWDASNYASGIYFSQLRAGDFIQTKKMVLLK